MDGREAMALSGGSASYYIHRGGGGPGSGSGSQPTGLHNPSGFRPLSNPGIPTTQPNVRAAPPGSSSVGPTFSVDPGSFPHGSRMAIVPLSSGSGSEPPVTGKKKRGRPRKYGPDGPGPVSLRLSSLPGPQSLGQGSSSPTPKRNRGRPPGSGRKQQLAQLGEWMNNSAGIAFAPHVITVGAGEDIVSKLLSFAQQRPRALCILSGSGLVSSVSLRQPASTGVSVTYEGRFQILCLSGSYLVTEDGGPRSRLGGVSASLASPDGHVVGGGVAVLMAASPVQVVVCSFVHGNIRPIKDKQIAGPKLEDSPEPAQHNDKLTLQGGAPPGHSSHGGHGHSYNPSSSGMWSGSRGSHTGIDLTRG